MIKAKFKNICNILNGYAFKSNNYVDDGIRIIRITNVQKGIIEDSDPKFYPNEEEKKLQKYLLNENDLLISLTGNVGRVGLLRKDLLPAALNQRVGCIRIKDKNKLNIRYLFQLLNSNTFENICISNSKGIAQKNLSTEWLKEYEFIIPNMEEQLIIAEKLENIQKIITIKQLQLCKLDELIKSLFVEMFENKDYEKKSLNSISLGKGEYGSGAKAGDYKENLPRYVRITDINENGTLNDNFSSPLNEKKIEKYSLNYGDIIFARTGATVGKTYMYSEKDGCCIFAGFCIRFKLNTKLVNPKYIFKFTQTEKYKAWIKNKQRIVAQPNINAKEYGEELLIPIPPIELQNKFTEFVNQIDKQKFEIQNSLNKMKALYETLMNKYFG